MTKKKATKKVSKSFDDEVKSKMISMEPAATWLAISK